MKNWDCEQSQEYMDGVYRGITLVRSLAEKLLEDDKKEMADQMLGDMELISLLLKKYDLIDDEEYDYLSDKADEEWEESHEPLPASAFNGLFGSLSLKDLNNQPDRERDLRIRLLEQLAEECEDDLYNEVAMGLDDELFHRLLKEYGIE